MSKKYFIEQCQEHVKYFKDNIFLTKIKLLIYSLFPVALIMGSAASEGFVILIDIIFVYELFKNKKFPILKNRILFIFLLIWLALIINYEQSLNKENSLLRNIFFFKYIIFSFSSILFFKEDFKRLVLIINIWFLILLFFSIDLLFQFIFDFNIIGLTAPMKKHRLSGFFGEEQIAGAFLLYFAFTVCGYKLKYEENIKSNFLFLSFFFIMIFLSGERSAFIKSLIIIIPFIFFFNKIKKKYKTISFCTIAIIFLTTIYFKQTFYTRYVDQVKETFINFEKTNYGNHYITAYKLFSDNIFFGVGNKNFRIICNKDAYEFLKNIKYEKSICTTHPHQIYFEFLSEHGLFGFSILIVFLLTFFYKRILYLLKNKNEIFYLALLMNILLIFIPFLPSGSFFSSFNASIFWLNISILLAYEKKRKLFCDEKKI